MEYKQNEADIRMNKERYSIEADLFAEILSRMDEKQKDEQNNLPQVLGKKASRRNLDLRELFYYLLSKLYLILLGILLGALFAGLYVAARVKPIYTATSKLYIMGKTGAGVITEDYKEVFKTWEVHQMVNEELGTNYHYAVLQSMITVTNPKDTRILYIMAQHPDSQAAADIANAYASAAKRFIAQAMDINEPSTFSIALEPGVATGVNLTSYVFFGILMGAVLTCGLLVLFFLLDCRPKSPEDILRYADIPTLAVIPSTSNLSGTKMTEKKVGKT